MDERDEDLEGMIEPGSVEWFSADEFDGYLWGKRDSVWVSLITSLKPGNGNLSKLFEAILASGRAVKVPTPFAHMQDILERKGFERTEEETRHGPCEVWVKRPSAISEAA